MLTLAHADSSTLTEPVSYPYPALTPNITGTDSSSRYYRQFARYVLYTALQTMTSSTGFSASNFTLQNQAGSIACKMILAPPSASWKLLLLRRSQPQTFLPTLLPSIYTRITPTPPQSQRLRASGKTNPPLRPPPPPPNHPHPRPSSWRSRP